jgi:transposase-like protein|tara:strand:- start:846 stop:1148 length:303 start_codon:yes stop_codon:yes gene_type:complete
LVVFERVRLMKKKHTGPQIVAKLRQADVLIGQGKSVPEVCREIEVSQQTYYRWRQKYGGMSPDMIKQLRLLQKENKRLRRVVSDQALDITILKEAAEGNF